jgi:hypothetical protein
MLSLNSQQISLNSPERMGSEAFWKSINPPFTVPQSTPFPLFIPHTAKCSFGTLLRTQLSSRLALQPLSIPHPLYPSVVLHPLQPSTMDTRGNSRPQGHPGQSPHPLEQLKILVKDNCCEQLKNWCREMYQDFKDMGKNLKDSFRPEEAKQEAQQNRERTINEFLNSNKRNPRDHTFRVFHPEPQMTVG